ncbi:PO113 protein, partial [Crotophaga sulcirostris]|nr:PO113 protein [Crotophaga sulcirostris]
NSPTMCQLYVSWALAPLRAQLSDTIIYHYMDDILLCQKTPIDDALICHISKKLAAKGLVIAPEKVQRSAPWKYLGWKVNEQIVTPQKIEIRSTVQTLNDLQQLIGELQWVRNVVGMTNQELAPLMSLLRGTDPTRRIEWLPEHQETLHRLNAKIIATEADRLQLNVPIGLVVCNFSQYPFALMPEKKKKKSKDQVSILEWIFPPFTAPKSIWQKTEAIGHLIRKGRQRCKDVSGNEPTWLSLPVRLNDLEWMMQNSEPLQLALLGFAGTICNMVPPDKRVQFIMKQQWIQRSKVVSRPISGQTVFTDAGERTRRAACVWKKEDEWHKYIIEGGSQDSLQTLELAAIAWALMTWKDVPINIMSDSQYAVGVVQRIEDALIKPPHSRRLGELFLQIQRVINIRTEQCSIFHIRSHCNSLGL